MDNTNSMTGREYGYQADITVGNRMFHVRADTQTRFEEIVDYFEENYGVTFHSSAQATLPVTSTPVTGGVCKTCGAATLPEKRITGKDGRSWWVQDCSTGDKTHKGPIRPAV